MAAKKWDEVKVNYVGKFKNGEIFDTNQEKIAKENDIHSPKREYQPVTFQLGESKMIPGFEKGLLWMDEGEEKTINVKPEEGYGERSDKMVKSFTTGDEIFQRAGEIMEIGDDYVKIDYNNPMAGKTLTFDVEIVETKEDGEIEDGDTVKINYVGKFENGEVFDTNIEKVAKENENYHPKKSYEPIKFQVGQGQMIAGISDGVKGMEEGDEDTLEVPPQKGYGSRKDERIRKLHEGDMVHSRQGQIKEIGDGKVVIDFNNPMAGKELIFDVELLEVN